MTAASDYLEAKILDDYFVNETLYLALFPADTGEDNTQSAQIGTRKPATWTRTGNRISLAADVSWPEMPDAEVGSVAVMTAETGGYILTHGPLTMPDPGNPGSTIPAPPVTVAEGDTFTLPAGSLAITVD